MIDEAKNTTGSLSATAPERVPERVPEPEGFKGNEEQKIFPSSRRLSARRSWWRVLPLPVVIVFVVLLLLAGTVGYGLAVLLPSTASTPPTNSNSMANMPGMNSNTAHVPEATQTKGNQLATYVTDPDGAKHFTFTAQQVMWHPVKGGQPVLAWTINGTVPGPMIRVTAGDHVRVTLINHFPEATTLHWHGLQIPAAADGVVGVGQQPVQPGQSYVYDFTVHDVDVGTHWYHSHYNDVVQVPGGMYGAFIVDPVPGSQLAKQAVHADVEYTLFLSELGPYYVLNGKSFPDTEPIQVKHGQTVLLRLIGASEMIHPLHLHGHSFNVIAQDGYMPAHPISTNVNTLPISPGETFDITFSAWAAPGSVYPLHCHILSHLMNPGQMGNQMGGMITLVEYAK